MSQARVTVASAEGAGGETGAGRWSAVAPPAFAVLLGLVYAVLFWRELGSGLEFDEAFNLTVVRNLADGVGYASNGAVQGVGVMPFDPYVTTGPTLLVPAAGVWGLTGSLEATRVVPLAFFVVYLAAAWVLGRRVAGAAGGLAAVASPLLLAVGVRDLTTLSLVPGRLVGELPACALLMSAVVLLPSRRVAVAALGGLCAGLAIQTKLSFLAAAGIIGLAWLVADYRAAGRVRPGRWTAVGLGAALPTLAFEAYRWRSLGDGYGANVEALRAFLSSQTNPPGYRASGARVKAFPDLLSTPGLTLLVLAFLAVVVLEAMRRAGRDPQHDALDAHHAPDEPEARTSHALVTAQVVAGMVLGAVWVLSSSQPSLRQGLPTLFLCLPVLAAAAAGRLARPGTTESTNRTTRVGQAAALAAAAALVAVTAYAGTRIALGDDAGELLDQQRAAAQVLEDSGTPSLPVESWWTLPEFQVLTDLPVSNSVAAGQPTVRVFSAVRALLERGSPDARLFRDRCREELYASWGVLVCR